MGLRAEFQKENIRVFSEHISESSLADLWRWIISNHTIAAENNLRFFFHSEIVVTLMFWVLIANGFRHVIKVIRRAMLPFCNWQRPEATSFCFERVRLTIFRGNWSWVFRLQSHCDSDMYISFLFNSISSPFPGSTPKQKHSESRLEYRERCAKAERFLRCVHQRIYWSALCRGSIWPYHQVSGAFSFGGIVPERASSESEDFFVSLEMGRCASRFRAFAVCGKRCLSVAGSVQSYRR